MALVEIDAFGLHIYRQLKPSVEVLNTDVFFHSGHACKIAKDLKSVLLPKLRNKCHKKLHLHVCVAYHAMIFTNCDINATSV